MTSGHHSRPRRRGGRLSGLPGIKAVSLSGKGAARVKAAGKVDGGKANFKLRVLLVICASFFFLWLCLKLLAPLNLWPLLVVPIVVAAWFFYEIGALVTSAAAGLLLFQSPLEKTGAVVIAALTFMLLGFLLGWGQRRQKDAHRHVLRSSLTDALTGLYNYGYFMDCLDREICRVARYGGAVTLIMFDVDHFKMFNDRFGHQAGNEALKALGAALRRERRESDIVARFGGEEFVLLLPGDEAAGVEIAGRVRGAISQVNIPAGGATAKVTVSAGVACYPRSAASKEELLDRVDQLLYSSKKTGRDRVSVAPAKRRLAAVGAGSMWQGR